MVVADGHIYDQRMTGIFCIETEWDPNPDNRQSVRPMLEILENEADLPYFHRDALTKPELDLLLARWKSLTGSSKRPYLYLAGHGEPRRFGLSGDTDVALPYLRNRLASDGWSQRVVHFGACSILDGTSAADELSALKARAVVGYREWIPWIDSAAMDLMIMSRLAPALNGWNRAIVKEMRGLFQKRAPGLVEDLGVEIALRISGKTYDSRNGFE